jgi:hypothetical protein
VLTYVATNVRGIPVSNGKKNIEKKICSFKKKIMEGLNKTPKPNIKFAASTLKCKGVLS